MVELPEAYVLAEQLNSTIAGRTIIEAEANHSPHGFAFYSRPPELYAALLAGQVVRSVNAGTEYTCGGNVEILCDEQAIVLSTPIKYHAAGAKIPDKHQLRLLFDDGASVTCTVQMWGAMLCVDRADGKLPEQFVVNKAPEPFAAAFDYAYFKGLAAGKEKLSAKAFLATEQRIPGLGNGVLQDILFHCGIHPKRKLSELAEVDFRAMFDSVKSTLRDMRAKGGRDTEKDIFGHSGGYQTKLSAKTKGQMCPVCGNEIAREAYLGGNIYFCRGCQPYAKS